MIGKKKMGDTLELEMTLLQLSLAAPSTLASPQV